ncbi:Transmembrane protein [Thalictrum thalictroides]|uniref:Transmembrane protein n=1 Tax=Thalictrum thalictroides TaxID=46969 RepID=A0A7J6USI2_THATH|nr:Transmembrane protein [Thalictrum thalictroides]
MLTAAIKLQVSNPTPTTPPPSLRSLPLNHIRRLNLQQCRCTSDFRLSKILRFSTISLQSNDASVATSQPSLFTSSVGSPPSFSPPLQWNLTNRHILLLNAVACLVAISTSWLFFSAIPALMAFRRAAESLEKLMDVMREELPDTMAAVRLSGMEISDLTMELSDLGQEITKGVRSSTQAVRVAEDRLRRLSTMVPKALVQGHANLKKETMEPVLAKTARGLREGIVKGRAFLQMFFSITKFSKVAMNYIAARRQKLT